MFKTIQTPNGPKLTELSLKQRGQLVTYLRDKQYSMQGVTWREFLQESRLRPTPVEVVRQLIDSAPPTPMT